MRESNANEIFLNVNLTKKLQSSSVMFNSNHLDVRIEVTAGSQSRPKMKILQTHTLISRVSCQKGPTAMMHVIMPHGPGYYYKLFIYWVLTKASSNSFSQSHHVIYRNIQKKTYIAIMSELWLSLVSYWGTRDHEHVVPKSKPLYNIKHRIA